MDDVGVVESYTDVRLPQIVVVEEQLRNIHVHILEIARFQIVEWRFGDFQPNVIRATEFIL